MTTGKVRWLGTHPEASQLIGTIPDLERFDAQFFKVYYRLGNSMDPMSRKILEQAYNAIYDAGKIKQFLKCCSLTVLILPWIDTEFMHENSLCQDKYLLKSVSIT